MFAVSVSSFPSKFLPTSTILFQVTLDFHIFFFSFFHVKISVRNTFLQINQATHDQAVVLQNALQNIPNPTSECMLRNVAIRLAQQISDEVSEFLSVSPSFPVGLCFVFLFFLFLIFKFTALQDMDFPSKMSWNILGNVHMVHNLLTN